MRFKNISINIIISQICFKLYEKVEEEKVRVYNFE